MSDHSKTGTMPVQLIGLGRGRVGKTAFLNAVIQAAHDRGGRPGIWNADRQNQTHSLKLFHPEAEEPGHEGFEDIKLWLEARMHEQSAGKHHAVLDVGGGDLLIKKLAKEVRLVRTLERMGIRPVAAHVIGPEKADLDYLRQVSEDGLFMPEATLILLNGGLVSNGRSVRNAFDEVLAHPVLGEAVKRGAEVVRMPALPCMTQVTDRGLTFAEAAAGVSKAGQDPLSFFDQERVAIWWQEEMPAFFARIPAHWLPFPGGGA